jgi:hypothetical protein
MWLKALPESELARLGIQDPPAFNCRTVLRKWLAQKRGRNVQGHPLWAQWRIHQLRGAALLDSPMASPLNRLLSTFCSRMLAP